jgi:hypothetical protein
VVGAKRVGVGVILTRMQSCCDKLERKKGKKIVSRLKMNKKKKKVVCCQRMGVKG